MLEVFVARRSRGGVVIPVARSHDEELVQLVASWILREMDEWDFSDEVLSDLADRERAAFRQILEDNGFTSET